MRFAMPLSGFVSFAMSCVAAVGCTGAQDTAAEVSVTPSPSVRQGQANVTLTVVRGGGGLADVSSVAVDDLTVARRAESSDTRLVLDLSVPHGVPLGPRKLTWVEPRGEVTIAHVVDVGAITAGPSGNDINLGTPTSSFRTLGAALKVAGTGDTIHLLTGTYDQTAGETWGYQLPENVTLSGASSAETELLGPGMNGGDTRGTFALAVPHGGTVSNLSIDFFDTGVDVTTGGTLTISGLEMSGHQAAAVHVGGAGGTVTVSDSVISADQDALSVDAHGDGGTLSITGSTLSSVSAGHAIEITETSNGCQLSLDHVSVTGDVLVSDLTANLTVTSSEFREGSVPAPSSINFGGDQLTLLDSTITLVTDNSGVNFHGRTLDLTGVTVTGGNYGVYQLQGSSRTRGTTIRDYKFIGFYMAEGDLDLGTATDPGNNVFSSAATGPAVFGLYLDAVANSATSSNTSFNGVVPPAGTIVAGDTPYAQPGQYFINTGKTLSFSVL